MTPEPSAGLLQIITASVTPVVMISTCAVLILGISNKHQALSERVRILVTEYRAQSTLPARRSQISSEIAVFRRRIGLSSIAHKALYIAVTGFIVVMLLIFFGRAVGVLWVFATGVGLMLLAVFLELVELQLGSRTLDVELGDIK